MKPFHVFAWCVALCAVLSDDRQADAQMFGQRSGSSGLGSSNRGAGSLGSGSAEGNLLQGNERFVRGNRRGSNFIGTDARDRRGFVGMQQQGATQTVAPAAAAAAAALRQRRTAARDEVATGINRNTGTYQPRLAVAFDVPSPGANEVSEALARRLSAIPGLDPADRIEVSVEAGTARLRGVVASARDRALVETLALFEPGIWNVENGLQVKAPGGIQAPAPATVTPSPSDRSPGTAK